VKGETGETSHGTNQEYVIVPTVFVLLGETGDTILNNNSICLYREEPFTLHNMPYR